jgi:hypothetical protein
MIPRAMPGEKTKTLEFVLRRHVWNAVGRGMPFAVACEMPLDEFFDWLEAMPPAPRPIL